MGRVFSPESCLLRDADAVRRSGRHPQMHRLSPGALGSRAVGDPVHVREHLAWEPGGPGRTEDPMMNEEGSPTRRHLRRPRTTSGNRRRRGWREIRRKLREVMTLTLLVSFGGIRRDLTCVTSQTQMLALTVGAVEP